MPSSSYLKSLAGLAVLGLAALGPHHAVVNAQGEDEVIWHNRYHALLAMAAYGDWQTLCPQQTFTANGLQKNFPGSTEDPWTVIETFGPTEHGAEGWSAYLPEMNKVTIIFKGDYNLEKNLPTASADLGAFNLGDRCVGCRANAFVLAGYLEALQETNNFKKTLDFWNAKKEANGDDLYFSLTGHGLGGAHSILSTIHLGSQDIVTFSHNYGTPRVLNPAAAAYHDYILGGNQLDRGAANADIFMSLVPQSADYVFANTGVWYYGYNETFHMNSEFCYEQPEDPACLPQGDLNEQDHYFYFANVGQCGGTPRQNLDIINAFIAQEQANGGDSSSVTVPGDMSGGTVIAANATTATTSSSLASSSSSTTELLTSSSSSTSIPLTTVVTVSNTAAATAATTNTAGIGAQANINSKASGLAASSATDPTGAGVANTVAGTTVLCAAVLASAFMLL